MSYVNNPASTVKGAREELFFDKDQFLFATNFASNPYFADELNWAKIAVYYQDSGNNQKKIIVLKDYFGRGWFAPSVMSRTGAWHIEKIEIYDKQGDRFEVTRSNMPSPQDFDIAVQRVIAPSPLVSAVVSNSEKVINGTFDSDISGWTSINNASWNAGVISFSANAGAERGAYQQIATEAGKTYEYSVKNNTASSADFVVANGSLSTAADIMSNTMVERLSVPQGTFIGRFTALSSGVTVYLRNSVDGQVASMDDVSIKEVPHIVETAPLATQLIDEGFKIRLWDDAAGDFLSNEVYTIVDIQNLETKDVVVLDKQIVGLYAGKTIRLRFPSYSQVSGKQASLFQYVGEGY